ncbi:hypothetical protein Tco_0574258 [Tanacetum coccineum]
MKIMVFALLQNFVNHVPTGRFTNGRLVSDFIASYAGVKDIVPAYLDPTLGIQDLMTGVTFASAGTGFDPMTATLSVTASQMEENQITQIPSLSSKIPWFVAQTPEDQIFYTIHNARLLYRCRIPELIGSQIRASFHGWIVLSRHPSWFLWNPLAAKLIRHPPLILMKDEPDQCCLSSPPADLRLIQHDKTVIDWHGGGDDDSWWW